MNTEDVYDVFMDMNTEDKKNAATCNADGCGQLSTTPLSLSYPDLPSDVSVTVVGPDEISFDIKAPVNTGVFDITE